jgi:hypothetical protein
MNCYKILFATVIAQLLIGCGNRHVSENPSLPSPPPKEGEGSRYIDDPVTGELRSSIVPPMEVPSYLTGEDRKIVENEIVNRKKAVGLRKGMSKEEIIATMGNPTEEKGKNLIYYPHETIRSGGLGAQFGYVVINLDEEFRLKRWALQYL